MAQTDTKRTTIKSVLHTKEFQIGFNEAKAGKPMQGFIEKGKWSYERGRQFYFYCLSKGRPNLSIKEQRYGYQRAVVSWEAIEMFANAYRERAIL